MNSECGDTLATSELGVSPETQGTSEAAITALASAPSGEWISETCSLWRIPRLAKRRVCHRLTADNQQLSRRSCL
jgi:hypothetical protein